MKYKATHEGGRIISKVAIWATQHNVGYPKEMKQLHLKADVRRTIMVKYAPRPTFRIYHIPMFMHTEHVLVEYWLYKYEKQLSEPLWIHIIGSTSVKPIMRNHTRRKIRQGIHAALAEKGWAADGTIAKVQTGRDRAARKPPDFELKGSITIWIFDSASVLNSDPAKWLEVGRHIVRQVEAKQHTKARKKINPSNRHV